MTTRQDVFPLRVAARSALHQGLITQEALEKIMADLDRQELGRKTKTNEMIRKASVKLLKMTAL